MYILMYLEVFLVLRREKLNHRKDGGKGEDEVRRVLRFRHVCAALFMKPFIQVMET